MVGSGLAVVENFTDEVRESEVEAPCDVECIKFEGGVKDEEEEEVEDEEEVVVELGVAVPGELAVDEVTGVADVVPEPRATMRAMRLAMSSIAIAD